MPTFDVEVYEIHTRTFRVADAKDVADAVKQVMNLSDNASTPLPPGITRSPESTFVESDTEHGMWLEEAVDYPGDLDKFLSRLDEEGVRLDDGRLPIIHSVEEVHDVEVAAPGS